MLIYSIFLLYLPLSHWKIAEKIYDSGIIEKCLSWGIIVGLIATFSILPWSEIFFSQEPKIIFSAFFENLQSSNPVLKLMLTYATLNLLKKTITFIHNSLSLDSGQQKLCFRDFVSLFNWKIFIHLLFFISAQMSRFYIIYWFLSFLFLHAVQIALQHHCNISKNPAVPMQPMKVLLFVSIIFISNFALLINSIYSYYYSQFEMNWQFLVLSLLDCSILFSLSIPIFVNARNRIRSTERINIDSTDILDSYTKLFSQFLVLFGILFSSYLLSTNETLNIFLRTAAFQRFIVELLQLEKLFQKHKNCLKALHEFKNNSLVANSNDFDLYGRDCSICFEYMETAIKTHCGHIFHNHCLRQWLALQPHCPICRANVLFSENNTNNTTSNNTTRSTGTRNNNNNSNTATTYSMSFNFGGRNSWAPTFSFHTVRTPSHFPIFESGCPPELQQNLQTLQEIFPEIPANALLADLTSTRDITATIDNVINQRIRISPPSFRSDFFPAFPQFHTTSSSSRPSPPRQTTTTTTTTSTSTTSASTPTATTSSTPTINAPIYIEEERF